MLGMCGMAERNSGYAAHTEGAPHPQLVPPTTYRCSPILQTPLRSPWHRSAAPADIWISSPQHRLFLRYNTQYFISCIHVSMFCILHCFQSVNAPPCCRWECEGFLPPRTSRGWRPCRGFTWAATPCPSASTTPTRP